MMFANASLMTSTDEIQVQHNMKPLEEQSIVDESVVLNLLEKPCVNMRLLYIGGENVFSDPLAKRSGFVSDTMAKPPLPEPPDSITVPVLLLPLEPTHHLFDEMSEQDTAKFFDVEVLRFISMIYDSGPLATKVIEFLNSSHKSEHIVPHSTLIQAYTNLILLFFQLELHQCSAPKPPSMSPQTGLVNYMLITLFLSHLAMDSMFYVTPFLLEICPLVHYSSMFFIVTEIGYLNLPNDERIGKYMGTSIVMLKNIEEAMRSFLTVNALNEFDPKYYGVGWGQKLETTKIFLNCLCLLLRRLDNKRFDSTISEIGRKISRILVSHRNCTDEDVIVGTVSIFKAIILKPNHSYEEALVNSRQENIVILFLLELLDEKDGTSRAVVDEKAYGDFAKNKITLKHVPPVCLFLVRHTPFPTQHVLCLALSNYNKRCCSSSACQIENIIYIDVQKTHIKYIVCDEMEWLIAWV